MTITSICLDLSPERAWRTTPGIIATQHAKVSSSTVLKWYCEHYLFVNIIYLYDRGAYIVIHPPIAISDRPDVSLICMTACMHIH